MLQFIFISGIKFLLSLVCM